MKSWTKPTAEQLGRAQAMLTQGQYHRRFFGGLKNPEWIVPLREKGWFSHPPPAERDAERGTIGFRAWAASEYLTRMAAEAPEIVTETILSIPETDNYRVHEDCIEAALQLPPVLAVRIAKKESRWLRSEAILFTLLPQKLGRLCAHLAAGGEKELAIEVLVSLLSIRYQPQTAERDRYKDRASARIDAWHYRDLLKKHLPELTKSLGMPVLELLAGELDRYMMETGKEYAANGRDHSYIWRPAIESHSQNSESRLEDALIAGCRDAAELLVQSGTIPLDKIVEAFHRRQWLVFQRLAIHLIRKHGTNAEVNACALRKDLFDELCVRHEYAYLLRDRAEGLSTNTIENLRAWIGAGPDASRWEKNVEEDAGRKPSEAELNAYKDAWRRERLAWFQDKLPAILSTHFADVLKRCPEPEHADFPSYVSSGWVGEESPKSEDELRALTTASLVDFLRSWQPVKEGFREATRDGLAQQLAKLVKSDPQRFLTDASAFIGLDPTYLRWMLHPMEEAVRADPALDVSKFLDLCEWIIGQTAPLPGPRGRDEDPNWSWARKGVASFLKFALQKDSISTDRRSQIWRILFSVTQDADPAPADEPEVITENASGPETVSLNTARGQAFHAIIQYGLWVHRQLDKLPDGKTHLARGFAEMPELQQVLDEHLDIEKDPSPAIRSVYGQWFPWLLLLDPAWARAAASRIFPTASENDRQRNAAWLTYLSFCRPYDNVFDALRTQYAAAIDRLGTDAIVKSRYGDSDERLGQHLVTYYWRGTLSLEPGTLLARYFTDSTDKMRASLVEHVGRSLTNTKGAVPEDYLERMKQLWVWLVESGPLATAIGPETAAAFGWWFVSEKLPLEWALPRLVKAVRWGKKIDPEHLVAEHLSRVSPGYPLESVQIYEVLARNDKEGWNISHWEKEARTALEHACRAPDRTTKKAATELIHYLGTRGYINFGDLLAKEPR